MPIGTKPLRRYICSLRVVIALVHEERRDSGSTDALVANGSIHGAEQPIIKPSQGVQELKRAGDIVSSVAFVSDIPEADYEAALNESQPQIIVTDNIVQYKVPC
jgi:hypothetical protein